MIAARLVERQMIKTREEEGRLALEKVRKQNHFESTESTCSCTVSELLVELKGRILEEYSTSTLTAALRAGPSGEEKVRIWKEIKIISFCKTSAYIISHAFIGVLVRVQLNVLAGYLFKERVSISTIINNNRDPSSASPLSTRVKQKYLDLAKYFLAEGYTELCGILFVIIKQLVDPIPLQEKLKISDLEKIFQQILHSLSSECLDTNLFFNPGKFLLSNSSSSSSPTRDLKSDELELFSVLVSETLEILETEEVVALTRRICQQGFAFITDKLAETFVDSSELSPAENPGTCPEENAATSSAENSLKEGVVEEFISPCVVSVPLVKLVPALLSLVEENVEDETGHIEEDEWIQHIIMNGDLKILGANIYETFCFKQEEPLEQESWTKYLTNSISSFF